MHTFSKFEPHPIDPFFVHWDTQGTTAKPNHECVMSQDHVEPNGNHVQSSGEIIAESS